MAHEAEVVRDRLAGVCGAAVRTLPVDGASIALSTRQGAQAVGYATDDVYRRLDEAQVTAGEGPAIDALRVGVPVLVDDLAGSGAGRRWPAFTPVAREAQVHALFALPLRIGAIRLGVLSLFRLARGALGDADLSAALRLADAGAYALLGLFESGDTLDGAATGHRVDGNGAAHDLYRATVHQASGMVMVQLDVPIDEALARMRAYAYAEDRPLAEVARAVVARSLRLER
jgi:hypothetical protein